MDEINRSEPAVHAVGIPVQRMVRAQVPKRVKLSRAKGWRMPPNTVKVARPCALGNPFVIGRDGVQDARQAVERFEAWLLPYIAKARPFRVAALEELRGKHLACWCRLDQPCHADVLLRLANE